MQWSRESSYGLCLQQLYYDEKYSKIFIHYTLMHLYIKLNIKSIRSSTFTIKSVEGNI